MHDLLDDYAHENGFRDANPRLKLLIGIGSILICAFSTSPVAPLLIAAIMSITLIVQAGIPGRFYSRIMAVPLSFALISSLAVVFLKGGDPLFVLPLGLTVSSGGLDLAALLLARTLGGTSSLFFIALTTPMVEIFSILKSAGLPSVLVELSMLIYRYIFVLLDQAAMIHSAQNMRLGNSGLRSSFNSFSMLTSVLFIRSWEQGERLMLAMDSRAYNGRLDVLERKMPFTRKALFIAALYLGTMTAIALMTAESRWL